MARDALVATCLILVAGTLLLLLLPIVGASPTITFRPNAPTEYQDIEFRAVDLGNATNLTWRFGDGQEAAGVSVEHAYGRVGLFVVSLWYDDVDGLAVSTAFLNVSAAEIREFPLTEVAIYGGILLLVIISLALIMSRWTKGAAERGGVDLPWTRVLLLEVVILSFPLLLSGLGLTFLVPEVSIFYPVLIAAVIVGSIVWILVALLGGLGLRFMTPLFKRGWKSSMFKPAKRYLIAMPQEQQPFRSFRAEGWIALWDRVGFAIKLSVTPIYLMFLAVTIAGFGSTNLEEFVGRLAVTLAFTPLITAIAVPIQIIADSNLAIVYLSEREGRLQVAYFGEILKDQLRTAAGLGTILLFGRMFLLMNDYQGLDQGIVVPLLVAIYSGVFLLILIAPVIFLCAYLYSFVHRPVLNHLNAFMDEVGLEEGRMVRSQDGISITLEVKANARQDG